MILFEKLKYRIKDFIDSRVRSIKNQQQELQQAQFSYSQISQLFKGDNFIPFSAWAISPATILHILNDIQINKRQCIVEFGAGASTFYIAKLLKVNKIKAKFYTIESDINWAEELKKQLEIYELNEYVKVIYAPLKIVSVDFVYKEQQTWYDLDPLKEILEKESYVDLVLVDGPFGGSTPFARFSAIPFLKTKLKGDFAVFLDDINREDEWEIAFEWKKMLNCQMKFKGRHAYFYDESKFDISPLKIS